MRGRGSTEFRLIEEAAEHILNRYGSVYEPIDSPPVPVEMIAERLLGLRWSTEESGTLGNETVAALSVQHRHILIDERCSLLGRFNFTIAHEIGHWFLHVDPASSNPSKTQFVDTPSTLALFSGTRTRGGRKDHTEAQANRFAGALLVPRDLLRQAAIQYQIIGEDEIIEMAHLFEVSISCMLTRLQYLRENRELPGLRVDHLAIQKLRKSLASAHRARRWQLDLT